MGIKEEVARLWREYDLAKNKHIAVRTEVEGLFAQYLTLCQKCGDSTTAGLMGKLRDKVLAVTLVKARSLPLLELKADFAFAEASAAQRKLNCRMHGEYECPACEDIAATERRAAHAS